MKEVLSSIIMSLLTSLIIFHFLNASCISKGEFKDIFIHIKCEVVKQEPK